MNVIYVAFPVESYGGPDPNRPSTLDSDRTVTMPAQFTQMVEWQSRGQMPFVYRVITRPAQPDSLWLAFHPAGTYQTETAILPHARYLGCRPEATPGYTPPPKGDFEFIAEILKKVADSYAAASLPNPLTQGGFTTIVANGRAWERFGDDPPAGYAVRRASGLGKTVFDCLGVLVPDGFQLELIRATWDLQWSGPGTTLQILYHEYGHLRGYNHPPGSCPTSSDATCTVTSTEEIYFYGAYHGMRGELIAPFAGAGPLPFHLADLWHSQVWESTRETRGWYPIPASLTTSLKQLKIYDLRSSFGRAYFVPIDSIPLGAPVLIPLPGETWEAQQWRRQGFLVSYHHGSNEDGRDRDPGPGFQAVYPDSGLAIWHVFDERAAVHEVGGSGVAYLEPRPTLMDLESAWGRFADPQEGLPGSVPDPVNGFDNHDRWPSRSGFAHLHYFGSQADFFGIGRPEFSYRTNPSSFAQASPESRRQPQSVPSSVFIEVLEEGQDAGGPYAIVDLLLAPHEDILTPAADAVHFIGEPLTVTWTSVRTYDPAASPTQIIDTVDILFSRDGGVNYGTLMSGVANTGSFTWTPTLASVTGEARMKVVFHNRYTAQVGEDESDVFAVAGSPLAYVNRSGETQMQFDGTPSASVALDYDRDGKLDLFLAQSDWPAVLFRQSQLGPNGAPRMDDVTVDAFPGAGELPQPGLRSMAVGSFDRDNRADVFAAAATNARLYRNNGPNGQGVVTFSDAWPDAATRALADSSWTGAWGDYDKNGTLDLFIGKAARLAGPLLNPHPSQIAPLKPVLLKNVGYGASFTDVSLAMGIQRSPGDVGLAAVTAVWADYDNDNDHDLDLFVGDLRDPGAGASRLYLNRQNGAQSFDLSTNPAVGEDLGFVSGAVWADMDGAVVNGSTTLDLVVSQQLATGPSALVFPAQANGAFGPLIQVGSSLATTGVRVLDQDLNQRQDVLLLPEDPQQPPRLFANYKRAGQPLFIDIANRIGLASGAGRIGGAVAANFDPDGRTDLFLGRAQATGAFYYRNEPASVPGYRDPPQITIALEGANGANEGFGTGAQVVLLVNGQPVQTQTVDAGGATAGWSSAVLSFGTVDEQATLEAQVTWSEGVTQIVALQPNSHNVIEDLTNPTVVPATMSATYTPEPGGTVKLSFYWEDQYMCRETLDRVVLSAPAGCLNEPRTIQVGDPDVVLHEYAKGANERYYHRLEVSGLTCVPNCTYTWYCESSTDKVTSSTASTPKTVKTKVCAQ